jgi:hypothetical protein
MTKKYDLRHFIPAAFASCVLAASAQTPLPPPFPDMLQQKLEQMQQATARNEQQMHAYQWIEATSLTIDGTSGPPKQSICRYSADGTLLKTPLGPPGQQGMSGGRGGAIKKHIVKEEEEKIQGEVEQIHALTQLYLPFNQVKFKKVLGTGKVDIEHDGANGDAIILSNYAKAGDQLRFALDRATMKIERISVKTYFEEPKDVMTVAIRFSLLADGTMYPSLTSIEAPSKKLSITTVDSDFSKTVY